MGSGDLGHDRQAKATAASVPGAGRVQAHEALEDALPVFGGDALPVVVDRQHDAAWPFLQGQRNPAPGVVGRIVDQVADQLVELTLVARHLAGRHA